MKILSKRILNKTKKLRSIIFLLSAILVAAGIFFAYGYFTSKTASAAWFNENWLYRQAITVTVASSASDTTNVNTLIPISTSTLISGGKLQSSCQDLRFTNASGKLLTYYIDAACNTTSTEVVVQIDLVPKNTTTYTLYMYYGNPSAPAGSNSSLSGVFNGLSQSLAGYYPMNEASWNGTTGEVRDLSGNGKSGTAVSGAVITSSGKYANAGSFDGTNDYVNTGLNPSTTLGQDITMSAWVYPTAQSNYRGIMGDHGATGNKGLLIQYNGGWTGGFGDGTNWFTKNIGDLTLSQWSHVVYVIKGGASGYIKGYVNGAEITTQTDVSTNISHEAAFWIGRAYSADNRYFQGTIDDARVYNRILTPTEITNLYNNPGTIATSGVAAGGVSPSFATEEVGKGPAGYWKFDEGQGQTVNDSSSQQNNGTLGADSGSSTDDPSWITEERCAAGKCLYFDGGDYITLGDKNFGVTSSTTFSVWIKTKGNATKNSPLYTNRYPNNGQKTIYLFLSTDGKVNLGGWDGTNPSVTASSTTLVNDNKWHYVTGVRSYNSSLKIYVDGKLENTQTESLGDLTNTTSLIGKAQFTAGEGDIYFDGFIDDVKVYPYARTADEVKTDYLSGKAATESKTGTAVAQGAKPQVFMSDGLVGYWKMDETSWTNNCSTLSVLDSSGNSNNAKSCPASTGPTGGASGKYNLGGDFDKSDDYVQIPNSTTLQDVTESDYSISTWIKPDTTPVSSELSYGAVIKAGYHTGLSYRNNSKIVAGVYNTSDTSFSASSASTYSPGSWIHAVMTVNTTSRAINLYVNGKLEGTGSYTGTLRDYGTTAFTVGVANAGASCATDWTWCFDGTIDEVRIYNKALSSGEISSLYNWAPAPVGYWNFEETGSLGVGTTAYDKSGFNNAGIWNGTGSKHSDIGKIGKASKFNGSDDYIKVTDNSNISITKAITASAWIKAGAQDDKMIIGHYDTSSQRSWGISTEQSALTSGTTKFKVVLSDDGSFTAGHNKRYTSSIAVLDNAWHHIAFSFDGSTLKLYIDGIEDISPTKSNDDAITSLHNSTADMLIGAVNSSSPTGYFTGLIDDVRIYNYTRSPSQIKEDMNAGHPAVGSPISSAVGYWKFNEGVDNTCSGGANDACNSGSAGSTYDGAGSGFASPATTASGWTQSGKFSKALIFDGTDDYVDLSTGINITGSITLSAWAKHDSAQSGIIIGKRNSAADWAWFLRWNSDNTITCALSQSGNDDTITALTTTETFATGSFRHIVCTLDTTNTDAYLYVDGKVKASSASSISSIASKASINVNIGRRAQSDSYQYFDGTIDEVKVYNYYLTADQVKLDYNQGASIVQGALGNNSSYEKGAANQEYCIPGDTTSCVAPIARWDFNERKGTTAYDASGNAKNLAFGGAPTWTTGKYGAGLSYDGTDDYTSVAWNPNTTTGTIEAWVNIKPGNASTSCIFCVGDTDTQYYYVTFYITTANKLAGYSEIGGSTRWTLLTDSALSTGVWHHVAIIQDGTSPILYVDGVKVAQTFGGVVPDKGSWWDEVTTPTVSGVGVNPGKTPTVGPYMWFFNGKIDDVRIFNYVRTPAQIAWEYNRGKPVGYWKLDECQGTTANDSSGNNNNGTITIGASGEDTVGTCTTSSTAWGSGATGKRNASLSFDGTDDYINLGNPSILQLNSTVTVSAWIKTAASATSEKAIVEGKGYNLTVGVTTDKPALWIYNGSAWVGATSSDTVSSGTWYHLVGTFDGSTVKIYVNGVLKGTGSQTALADTGANLYIGNHPSVSRPFNGQIDDMKVFNYALTATQVKDIMNEGAVRYGPTTGSP